MGKIFRFGREQKISVKSTNNWEYGLQWELGLLDWSTKECDILVSLKYTDLGFNQTDLPGERKDEHLSSTNLSTTATLHGKYPGKSESETESGPRPG